MRNLFLLLFLLLTIDSFAQPGDPDLKIQLRYFNEIQDSISANPENLFYKWVRADLLFKPLFTIHTKSTGSLADFLAQSDQYRLYVQDSLFFTVRPCDMCGFVTKKSYNPVISMGKFLLENQQTVVDDLQKLIDSDTSFRYRFMNTVGQFNANANKADFLYKQGQLLYVTGKPEKALELYLLALENQPSDALKSTIYNAIAAYYFNIETADQPEVYQKTMLYLNLSESLQKKSFRQKESEPEVGLYENERIELMKKYKDSTSLVNYLQNKAAGYLNWYFSLLTASDKMLNSSNLSQVALHKSGEYEQQLYDYLKQINPNISAEELVKHKKIIVSKL